MMDFSSGFSVKTSARGKGALRANLEAGKVRLRGFISVFLQHEVNYRYHVTSSRVGMEE